MNKVASLVWSGLILLGVIGPAGCGKKAPQDGGPAASEHGESAVSQKGADSHSSQSKASPIDKAVSDLEAAFEESDRSVEPVVSMVKSGQYEAARLTLREIEGPDLNSQQQRAIQEMFRVIENR